MLWTLALGLLAFPTVAMFPLPMTVFHRYADMAAFNFPVDAGTLRPHLNPALSLDLDPQGQAWVSILSSKLVKTSINGLPIPLIKPHELQVRTYVTGPALDSTTPIKGVWMIDLFLHESSSLLPTGPDILGANLLWSKTIRVVDGVNIKLETDSASYNLTAPNLKVTDKTEAQVSLSATVTGSTMGASVEWFLQRDAWFGQTEAGELTVSMLRDQKYLSTPRKMEVSEFSSSVLRSLSLGDDFGVELCAQRRESCFFVGTVEASFESSKIVNGVLASTIIL